MKNSVIQKLINDLKVIETRNIELTSIGVRVMLTNALEEEKQQIIDAFEEGWRYGNSDYQTFDYPASRYYNYTYEKLKD